MRILMTEITTPEAGAARRSLESAGHTVVSCGDDTDRSLQCASLRGEPCPLDGHDVDVALYVQRPGSPSIADAGLLCALRRFVPVVAATRDPVDRTDAIATAATVVCRIEDVETALEHARRLPLTVHEGAAEKGANSVLLAVGEEASWRASVRREGRRLRVELTSDRPVARQLREASAERAAGAVRAVDPDAPTIDVATVITGTGSRATHP